MKRTEMVVETLAHVLLNHLMQLLAPESFTKVSHHESFILYTITQFGIKIAKKYQMEWNVQSTTLEPMHKATHRGLCPLQGEQPPGKVQSKICLIQPFITVSQMFWINDMFRLVHNEASSGLAHRIHTDFKISHILCAEDGHSKLLQAVWKVWTLSRFAVSN